jgi:hypothetical protein
MLEWLGLSSPAELDPAEFDAAEGRWAKRRSAGRRPGLAATWAGGDLGWRRSLPGRINR